MIDFLMSVASMVVAATFAIILVLLCRKHLQEFFGARIAYAFWAIVPIAMIASMLPADVVYKVDVLPEIEVANIKNSAVAVQPREVVESAFIPEDNKPFFYSLSIIGGLAVFWIVGVGLKIIRMAVQQRQIMKQTGLKKIHGNVFKASRNDVGPAVVGVLRPRIIVPENFHSVFSEEEQKLILAHEQSHIQAGDLRANLVAAAIKAVNWFNPLVYVAFNYFRMDQEFACDERVMRTHHAQRKLYAETLLKSQLMFQHTAPFSCAWKPSGMHPLTQRVGKLKNGEPTMTRRTLGLTALAVSALTIGSSAWATLASNTVYIESPSARVVEVTDSEEAELGSALVTTLLEGQRQAARVLVKSGANVNYFMPGDGTPLLIAADNGDLGMVNMLIEAGADVNKPAPGDGNPLIAAAGSRNLDIAGLLVKHGADVNGFVLGDETPLIQAVQNNDYAMTKFLVENGADVNLRVKTGNEIYGRAEYRSPLGQAELKASSKIVNYLKRQGATPVVGKED